jgi:hypothetical protein
MATFTPRVTFIGYPVDDRTPVTFKKKQESIEVSDAFAQLMREKGLVADPSDGTLETRPKRALKAPPQPRRVKSPWLRRNVELGAWLSSRTTPTMLIFPDPLIVVPGIST